MKRLMKLEELGQLLLSILLFSQLSYAWWVYLLLLLAPDLGMIGYLFGPRVGAVTYNTTHHKGLAAVLYAIGILYAAPVLALIGVIMFGHSSLARGRSFSQEVVVGSAADLLLADPQNAAGIGAVDYPLGTFKGVNVDGLDPVKLAALHSLFVSSSFGDVLRDYQPVAQASPTGPWLVRVPDQLITFLGSIAPPAQLSVAAPGGA